nr:hypothetical protein CTI12_AA145160 [Tanacetum cinerariifolium]
MALKNLLINQLNVEIDADMMTIKRITILLKELLADGDARDKEIEEIKSYHIPYFIGGELWRLIWVYVVHLYRELKLEFAQRISRVVHLAMETRTSTELKKILDIMEADKRDIAQQMKAMQDKIQELLLSNNHRTNGDSSDSDYSVNKEGNGSRQSNGIKVDIPEYDGKLDPDEFVEWLRTAELVFDYKHTTKDSKVKIVALKLSKYASTWWSNVCMKRKRRGKEKIRSWSKMKEKMKQKFLPSYYIQVSFSQLHSLRQGAGTAKDYPREYEYLLMKCDIPEDHPRALVRYLGGLESRVAHVVELHPYQTLAELTLLAHKVDSQQRTKGQQEFTRPNFKSNSYKKSPSKSQTTRYTQCKHGFPQSSQEMFSMSRSRAHHI